MIIILLQQTQQYMYTTTFHWKLKDFCCRILCNHVHYQFVLLALPVDCKQFSMFIICSNGTQLQIPLSRISARMNNFLYAVRKWRQRGLALRPPSDLIDWKKKTVLSDPGFTFSTKLLYMLPTDFKPAAKPTNWIFWFE